MYLLFIDEANIIINVNLLILSTHGMGSIAHWNCALVCVVVSVLCLRRIVICNSRPVRTNMFAFFFSHLFERFDCGGESRARCQLLMYGIQTQ